MGFIAAVFTTCASLPQVVKIIQTHDTHSLSLGMYIMQTISVILWFTHGIMIGDNALIIANALTGVLSVTILVFKLKEVYQTRS